MSLSCFLQFVFLNHEEDSLLCVVSFNKLGKHWCSGPPASCPKLATSSLQRHFMFRFTIPSAILFWILQGNDPGKFELILKIQSLQKRLIVKTQGLEERELLLQVYSSSRRGTYRQLTSNYNYSTTNLFVIIPMIALDVISQHFRFLIQTVQVLINIGHHEIQTQLVFSNSPF